MLRLLEIQRIVVRLDGFQAEHLNQGPRLLAEVQTGLNHFGIIEHHQAARRHVVGQRSETVFGHFAVAVNQQFGLVAHRQGKLGDTFVGQRIIEFADADMSGILFHNHSFLSDAKVRIISMYVMDLKCKLHRFLINRSHQSSFFAPSKKNKYNIQ